MFICSLRRRTLPICKPTQPSKPISGTYTKMSSEISSEI